MTTTIQEKFAVTRQELNASLIERQGEVDAALTGLICQESVLFVGQPGTAKSMLADAIVDWIDGRKFSAVLNKFSTPEEVFGPWSIPDLKQGRYRRITDRMIVEADVAFLDEIFNASTAILNTLLKVLNERKFVNDGLVIDCPLRLAISATNQWPEGKELGALFDRFLFRRTVQPVSGFEGRDRLLWDADLSVKLTTRATSAEIDEACNAARKMAWSDDAKEALGNILSELRGEGIVPGDRRVRKSGPAAQAFAWLCGSPKVETHHLEILQDVLWDDPADQPQVVAEVIGRIANPAGVKVRALVLEFDEVSNKFNPKDMTSMVENGKKMAEIVESLSTLAGSEASAAFDRCSGILTDLKTSVMNAR